MYINVVISNQTIKMKPKELIGRTISNIFETDPSIDQEGIPGSASYFFIVLELDKSELYELGAHSTSIWTRSDNLKPFENPSWAEQNNYVVLGKKITKVIQRDSEEYYDGSLTLVLENDLIVEHQTSN